MSEIELERLAERLRTARSTPLEPLPGDLRARTLAAVRDEAAREAPSPAPAHRRRLAWLGPRSFAAGLAVATAVAVAAIVIGGRPDGTLEADTTLAGTGGTADVEVREIGIGRTVDLRSDTLRILPKGEFYEVWFVGPGDSRARPNRISAGTFHPDTKGKSDVQLKAAVDPALYPSLEVTAEPGDGDPRASGPVVLHKRLALQR